MGNCFKKESTTPMMSSGNRHPKFIDDQDQRKIKKYKMKRAGTGYPGKPRKKRGRKNRTGHSPGWTSSSNPQQQNYDIFFIEHSEEPIPLERAL